jgi:hypothetical protein
MTFSIATIPLIEPRCGGRFNDHAFELTFYLSRVLIGSKILMDSAKPRAKFVNKVRWHNPAASTHQLVGFWTPTLELMFSNLAVTLLMLGEIVHS